MIEGLSTPCKLAHAQHNSEEDEYMGLHLVSDCYDDMPMYALDTPELAALVADAKEAALGACCSPVDCAVQERHFASKFGLTVATDMLVTHKRIAAELMDRKAGYVGQIWQILAESELHLLAGGAHQPQERPGRRFEDVRAQVANLLKFDLHLVARAALLVQTKPDRERYAFWQEEGGTAGAGVRPKPQNPKTPKPLRCFD